jgi:hypothetical protein
MTGHVHIAWEGIVWWQLHSRRGEINTQLELQPSALLFQLYIDSGNTQREDKSQFYRMDSVYFVQSVSHNETWRAALWHSYTV